MNRLERWANENSRLVKRLQVVGLGLAVLLILAAAGLFWFDWHRQHSEAEWIVRPFNHTAKSQRVK